MAPPWLARGWPRAHSDGDAPGKGGLKGDARQDRPTRCRGYRAAAAHGLVQAGPLQIGFGARDARSSQRSQGGSESVAGYRAIASGSVAQLRAEARSCQQNPLRSADPRTGSRKLCIGGCICSDPEGPSSTA